MNTYRIQVVDTSVMQTIDTYKSTQGIDYILRSIQDVERQVNSNNEMSIKLDDYRNGYIVRCGNRKYLIDDVDAEPECF